MDPVDVVIVLRSGYAFRQVFTPDAYERFVFGWRSTPCGVLAIPDHEAFVLTSEIAAVHRNRPDYFHLNDEN